MDLDLPGMLLRKLPLPLHVEHEVPPIDVLYDQEQPGRREGQRIRNGNCPEARARFTLVKGTSNVARVSGTSTEGHFLAEAESPLGADLLPLKVNHSCLKQGCDGPPGSSWGQQENTQGEREAEAELGIWVGEA